jgi:hypothetical protein
LLDAVDALPDPKAALQEAVGFVQEDRERSEGRKLIADAKRSNGKDLSEQAEIDLLRKIEQQARRPDLRRT